LILHSLEAQRILLQPTQHHLKRHLQNPKHITINITKKVNFSRLEERRKMPKTKIPKENLRYGFKFYAAKYSRSQKEKAQKKTLWS